MTTETPPAVLRLSAELGAGRPLRAEIPAGILTPAEINHLRRLLGWVRCEIGQAPDEMVPMVRGIVERLGDVSEEGKARLVEQYAEASNVPKYVRAAVKALEKTLPAAADGWLPEAEVAGPPALPMPNVGAKRAAEGGPSAPPG